MQNGHHTQLDGTLWTGAKITSVKEGRSKSPRKANHVRQKRTVCIHSEANERSAARQRWNRSRDGNPGGGVTGPEGGEEDGEDGPRVRGKGSVEPDLDLAVLDADAVHHVDGPLGIPLRVEADHRRAASLDVGVAHGADVPKAVPQVLPRVVHRKLERERKEQSTSLPATL